MERPSQLISQCSLSRSCERRSLYIASHALCNSLSSGSDALSEYVVPPCTRGFANRRSESIRRSLRGGPPVVKLGRRRTSELVCWDIPHHLLHLVHRVVDIVLVMGHASRPSIDDIYVLDAGSSDIVASGRKTRLLSHSTMANTMLGGHERCCASRATLPGRSRTGSCRAIDRPIYITVTLTLISVSATLAWRLGRGEKSWADRRLST